MATPNAHTAFFGDPKTLKYGLYVLSALKKLRGIVEKKFNHETYTL